MKRATNLILVLALVLGILFVHPLLVTGYSDDSVMIEPAFTKNDYSVDIRKDSYSYSYINNESDGENLTVIPVTSAEIEQGGYYYGRDSQSSTRLRIADQIYVEAGTTIKYNANGLRLFFAIVSGPDASSYMEGGKWNTDSGEFEVTKDGYLSIIISMPNAKDEIRISDYTSNIEIHMVSKCAHDYQLTVTKPTQASRGYTTHTCAICGHFYITDYTELKPYRILLIGNSFSQDAMREFAEIVQSMMGADFEVEIHLAINAAKTVAWHATQADENIASYKYRYYSTENDSWTYEDDPLSTLESIIACKKWDVVTLQSYFPEAGSGFAKGLDGESEKFLSLDISIPFMLDYIQQYAPQSKIYYYMIWQSTKDTSDLNAGLSQYQQIMKQTQIVKNYFGSSSGRGFDGVIPVGTAIQNARSTYLGLLNYTAPNDAEVVIGLQRDTVHMAYSVGCYIAALTFAEYLFPEDARMENYVLPNVPRSFTVGKLPKEYTEIAQKAVEAALKNPYTVTPIDGYTVDPADMAKEAIENADYHFNNINDETELLVAIQKLVMSQLPHADFGEPIITINSYALRDGVLTDLEITVTVRFGYTSRTFNVTKHYHKYTSVVTDPTCTEAGYATYACSGCDDSYIADRIDALGHNEVIDEGKEPTELKPGISDGKHCDRCGEVLVAQETIPALGVNKNFKISSARLSLDSDINIVYLANVPAEYTDFYMIFTFNGNDYRVEPTLNDDGRYRFLFDKVIPQMVGDNIVATLYATNAYGEVVTNCISEYSVRKYCINQLGKSNDAKLKTMLSDLLVYAEKAQLYSGYKTDMLVTAGLEDITTPTTFTSIDASVNKQQISGPVDSSVKWRSAGLVYENAMALYIKFAATDLDGLEVRITRNGLTQIVMANDFIVDADGLYKIYYRGIHFSQFDDTVTATFYRNGEQIGETLTYSVNSYIYRNQDNSNAKLRDLLRATYVYGESAKAYKNK